MTMAAALRQVRWWTWLLAFVPWASFAQVAVPPLSGHVTDLTGTLTGEQQSALEQTLAAYEARKGTQLAVLVVPTTAPEAIEQYALRVAELWKLGRKKVDDGLVLVVAKNDHAVRIEVGYGLEGAMSDITSKRIISETMLPRFSQGDFYGGIQAGMEQIMHVVDGEPLPAPSNRTTYGNAGFRQYAPFLMVLVLAVGGVLRSVMGRPLGAVATGAVVSVVAWFLMGALAWALLAGAAAMFFTLVGGGLVRGGAGGLLGGGRGGFGGDLGGFRGGGGGFGGGGASGRW